jgi:tight adherence protein C
MVLIVVTGLVLAGSALALVARAVALPRIHSEERLQEISSYGFPVATVEGPSFGRAPVTDGLVAGLGRIVSRRIPGARPDELQQQLMRAGMYTVSPDTFMGYRAIVGVGMPLFFLWFVSSTGASGAMALFAIVLGILGGLQFPLTYLRAKGDRRLAQIEYDLPELVDILVVTVEAGLGFSGSMKTAATKLTGPLREELNLTLQEQRMGLSTNEALENMLGRCDTPSMRSFVRSVLQGDSLRRCASAAGRPPRRR